MLPENVTQATPFAFNSNFPVIALPGNTLTCRCLILDNLMSSPMNSSTGLFLELSFNFHTKPDPNPNESLSFAIKESKVNESSKGALTNPGGKPAS